MSQIIVQSTIKYICENFTSLANNRNEAVIVSSDAFIGDSIVRVEPLTNELKSNRVMWFPGQPVVVTEFGDFGDTEVKVEPLQYNISEGSTAYPRSHVGVNDWSLLDDTWLEAPYLIIENAFRATSIREGYVQPRWTMAIQPHVAWRQQDIALMKVTALVDEIIATLEKKLLYPSLPAMKFDSFIFEEPPFFREHPNVPHDVPGEPMYAGQRVVLLFEDYFSSYDNLNLDDFFNQF